ncbi:hypothetical protein [Agrobacterium pusense]|uniref:hypothetical protein n=1 Tax=Agrobacterium pusense TaxID=648995 RepID=UPI000D34A4D9|nr:hypothetical protein [Agrobacterium pusense]PTV70238.1 hypothetical protein DBL06_25580 [Agrobacterium pusense]
MPFIVTISKEFSTPFIDGRLATLEVKASDWTQWIEVGPAQREELEYLRTLMTEDEKQQAVIQRYAHDGFDWFYQDDPHCWQCAA